MRWRKVRGWRTHSLACYDAEWQEWKQAAEMSDKSMNGWIREWLREGARYDRLRQRELADQRDHGYA